MKNDLSLDPWSLLECSFDPSSVAKNETLFTVANGALGLRGDMDEAKPAFHRGTYLNGFFEKNPIRYGESAYGFAENHETLLNVPDAKLTRLFIGSHEVRADAPELVAYERRLDFRTGILHRRLRVRTPDGVTADIRSRRLVSFCRESLASMEYAVTVVESPGPVALRLESVLDTAVRNRSEGKDPRVGSKLGGDGPEVLRLEGGDAFSFALMATRHSGLCSACAVAQEFLLERKSTTEGPVHLACRREAGQFVQERSFTLGAGEGAVLRRYAAYCMGDISNAEALSASVRSDAFAGLSAGFDRLTAEQEEYLNSFWRDADVEVSGDTEIQQALRFNMFHLLQSSGKNGKTSIAAKGLAGEGYEGHYFWDTEVYVCPFFTYTRPELARRLLEYRYSILPKARERARTMAEEGALFPWRTIDGEETSAYYPAGTAQYHINADIVYALEKYTAATGDREFLYAQGAEIVVETARLWLTLGHRGRDGRFRIDGVTGPDEYTAVVNNNNYTNRMAANNLRFAARVVEELRLRSNDLYDRLVATTGLREDERSAWEAAAEDMYYPYDPELGIYPQDDSFLDKEEWDFAGTPDNKYPLLLHFHPLVIYRHRVLKQPDLVLAQFLLSEQFSLAEKIRNYRYYEPLTTGDSSLSHCILSIMAAEIGDHRSSYGYFLKTVRMDLDDVHGNSRDGIHTAAMAGSWMSVVYGFAGFRDREGFSFDPRLPYAWTGLSFTLRLRGMPLRVDLGPEKVVYTHLRSNPSGGPDSGMLSFRHRNRTLELRPGESIALSLKPKLRAVLFDLDGVVTDTAEYHYRAWKRLADEEGWPFDREVNRSLKGVSRRRSLELLLERAGVRITMESMADLMVRKNRYYLESLDSLGPEGILPGIRELLSELGRRGISRVLASASRNARTILDKLGLGPVEGRSPESAAFDAVADAGSVALGKPDPELFLAAADLASCRPENCVGIEDAQAGLDALRAAGIRSVGIGPDLQGADALLEGTDDLTIELLEKLID